MQTLELKNLDVSRTIFIDTRSLGYYLISHVADAIHIESAKRIGYIAQENPDKIIALYCHTGAGAAEIAKNLREAGLHNVYAINANFFHLQKLGLPIVGEGASQNTQKET
ncbi:MAG: rhodanese-like domain-containing protein [Helicobacter sp.]|nr:rhodanese-like domain-containing protein [Helicobacter sp.]